MDIPYELTVTHPASESIASMKSIVTDGVLTIQGVVRSDQAADSIVVRVTLENTTDVPATVSETDDVTRYDFSTNAVNLVEGANHFVIDADIMVAGELQSLSQSITVTYQPQAEYVAEPILTILSPVTGSQLNQESFYIVGDVTSFSGDASTTVNGNTVLLDANQTQSGTFKELISFSNSNTVTITIELTDGVGQSTSQQVTYHYDNTPPVITLDELVAWPTENVVKDYPYHLSGQVADDNISSVTINGQSVTLVPLGDAIYGFDVTLPLVPNEATTLSIVARDTAGSSSSKSVLLRLDSEVTLGMMVPPAELVLVNQGAVMTQQVAARINGVIGGATATLQLLQGGAVITAHNLAISSNLISGSVLIPAQAGNYSIAIELIDGGNVIARTSREISVEDPIVEDVAVTQVEPGNGSTGVEPNGFVSVLFNQPIDPTKLILSVKQTVHGDDLF